jgi:hypothetical protein
MIFGIFIVTDDLGRLGAEGTVDFSESVVMLAGLFAFAFPGRLSRFSAPITIARTTASAIRINLACFKLAVFSRPN